MYLSLYVSIFICKMYTIFVFAHRIVVSFKELIHVRYLQWCLEPCVGVSLCDEYVLALISAVTALGGNL